MQNKHIKNKSLDVKHKRQREKDTTSSNIELKYYNFLLTLFDKQDIEQNYNKDNRYPYRCDYYIHSLDLFIEIQASWTHGPVPFDKYNKEHMLIFREWLNKQITYNSQYYKDAIYTWCVRDKIKHKSVQQNKLNFIEFYTNNIDDMIKETLKYIQNT